MNRLNKFACAINSWLTFEQMCKRECLFCESYLAYPIGQFLNAEYGEYLQTEYIHPVLAEYKNGRGDKPRIDFVVLTEQKEISIAIETKWISTSTTLLRDIIRDLIRLELVVHKTNAEGWFILAGNGRDFNELVKTRNFLGHPKHIGSNTILPYGRSEIGNIRLNPPAKFRKEFLKECLRPYIGMSIIDSITLTKFGPYPKEYKAKDYVTLIWKVANKQEKERFKPEDVFDDIVEKDSV